MNTKTYTFKNGKRITVRTILDRVFHAMGDTHIEEVKVFDVYDGHDFIETFETYKEALSFIEN